MPLGVGQRDVEVVVRAPVERLQGLGAPEVLGVKPQADRVLALVGAERKVDRRGLVGDRFDGGPRRAVTERHLWRAHRHAAGEHLGAVRAVGAAGGGERPAPAVDALGELDAHAGVRRARRGDNAGDRRGRQRRLLHRGFVDTFTDGDLRGELLRQRARRVVKRGLDRVRAAGAQAGERRVGLAGREIDLPVVVVAVAHGHRETAGGVACRGQQVHRQVGVRPHRLQARLGRRCRRHRQAGGGRDDRPAGQCQRKLVVVRWRKGEVDRSRTRQGRLRVSEGGPGVGCQRRAVEGAGAGGADGDRQRAAGREWQPGGVSGDGVRGDAVGEGGRRRPQRGCGRGHGCRAAVRARRVFGERHGDVTGAGPVQDGGRGAICLALEPDADTSADRDRVAVDLLGAQDEAADRDRRRVDGRFDRVGSRGAAGDRLDQVAVVRVGQQSGIGEGGRGDAVRDLRELAVADGAQHAVRVGGGVGVPPKGRGSAGRGGRGERRGARAARRQRRGYVERRQVGHVSGQVARLNRERVVAARLEAGHLVRRRGEDVGDELPAVAHRVAGHGGVVGRRRPLQHQRRAGHIVGAQGGAGRPGRRHVVRCVREPDLVAAVATAA